jgi:tetratricopeptide (TPR) repeat protein
MEGGGTDAAIRVFNQGAEAARVGDLDGALAAFEKARELDPELAPIHAALTRVHFDREEYEQVIASAEAALDLDPDLIDLQKLRYEAYRRTGQEEKAKEVFAEMAEADPAGLAQTLYERGREFFNQNQTEQAKTAFEQALQADPEHARAHYYLGLCFVNTGESAQAKEHLQKFLDLAPDDPEAGTAREMIQYMG